MQGSFKAENKAWERALLFSTCILVHRCFIILSRLLTYYLLLTIWYLLHYLPIPTYSISDILGGTF